jgi:GT2 family glycosyltransferase
MKIVVAIPTVDRRDVLQRTVAELARQTRLPDAVVVSTTDRRFVPEAWAAGPAGSDIVVTRAAALPFPIVCLFGKRGLPAQRNRVLDVLLGAATAVPTAPLGDDDIITFFDDDFIPAPDYLAEVAAAFATNPDWSVLTGHVPYDGAHNEGYSFDEGLALLRSCVTAREEPPRGVVNVGAYGCNMAIRARLIGSLRFDERLPLYGWQEDIDFTSQLRKVGAVVRLSSLVGVHLGTKTGRVGGLRFGYSQIANPFYLMRKGTMPAGFGVALMARNVAANIARSIWPESYVDRRGRLRGNLVALGHALSGRLEPEHILKL